MGNLGVMVFFGSLALLNPLSVQAADRSPGTNGHTVLPYKAEAPPPKLVTENLVHRYLKDTLHVPNLETVDLALRFYNRIKGLGPDGWKDPQNQAKIFESVFAPESAESLARMLRAYQRTAYSNSMVLGAAGVGKTHLIDQATAFLTFGLMPDYLKAEIHYTEDPNDPYSAVLAAFIGKTRFFIINESVLSQTVEAKGAPFSDTETRQKLTLIELHEAAKREFNRKDETGKRVGARTIFVFEEIARLPPLVNDTLKTLQDETGFHLPGASDFKVDFGFHTQGFTTHPEFRRMVKGDSAVERRYQITHHPEATELRAFSIVKSAAREWESMYGSMIDDSAIRFLIHFRKFLTSPPLAMPANVLAATNDLFIWKESHAGNEPKLIGLQDAQKYLMGKAGLTDIWFEGPNGEPPFHDFKRRVKEIVIGQDEVVDRICDRIIAWARYEMGSEVPVFFLGGPPEAAKIPWSKRSIWSCSAATEATSILVLAGKRDLASTPSSKGHRSETTMTTS